MHTRNRNRRSAIAPLTALLLATACRSDDPPVEPADEPRPVDARFAATVEGDGVPAGTLVSVDAFWRPDGKIDVTFDDGIGDFVPGPRVLKGVEIKPDNAVLNEGDIEIEEDGPKHRVRLEGTISPEGMDVTLTDTPPGGAPVMVRLSGDVRPLGDPAALDGEYLAFRQVAPTVICPGDTPGTPYGGRNVVIDVLAGSAVARVVIDGRLEAVLPIGDVAWTGTLVDRWNPDGTGYPASVVGWIRADDLSLTVDLAAESYGSGCVSRATFAGSKRIPDPAVIDGDWRAEYAWTDACHDDASGRFTASLALIEQDDGMVDLFEFNGGWMQFAMAPGSPFTGRFYDFGSGARIAYDGLIDPPDLSYTAVYTFPYEEPCDVTLEVAAYKRYFFPPEAE